METDITNQQLPTVRQMTIEMVNGDMIQIPADPQKQWVDTFTITVHDRSPQPVHA